MGEPPRLPPGRGIFGMLECFYCAAGKSFRDAAGNLGYVWDLVAMGFEEGHDREVKLPRR